MTDSLANELVLHAAALRRLARALVGAEHAEDLVQDTALAALRSPPRRTVGLGGWLSTILRRLATSRHRSDLRRHRRERAAALPEPIGNAAHEVARSETIERLTAACMALPEPYRETLLQRFFADLPPAALAAKAGISVETVKTRLKRGLAMLRTQLDDGDARDDWRRGLAVAFGLDAAPTAATAAGTTTGVLIMSTGSKLALAAVAAVAAATLLWNHEPNRPDPTVEREAEAAPAASATDAVAPMREPVAATRAASPTAAAATAAAAAIAPPPRGTIAVTVTRAGAPVASGWLLVKASPYDPWLPEDPLADAEVRRTGFGADGGARVEGLEPGLYVVGVLLGGDDLRQHRLQLGEQGEHLHLDLGSAVLAGHIHDPTGHPAAAARVCVTSGGWQGAFHIAVRTDPLGAFRVDGLPIGTNGISVQFAGTPGFAAMELVQLREGANTWDLGRRGGQPTWRGTVRTRGNDVVRGGGQLEFLRAGGGYAEVRLAADGTFAVALEPASYTVHLTLPLRPRLQVAERIELGATDHDRDLIVPGTTLVLTVTKGGAAPSPADLRRRFPGARPVGSTNPSAGRTAYVGDDGSVLVYGVDAGRWQVSCLGATPLELLVGAADVELRVALTLP